MKMANRGSRDVAEGGRIMTPLDKPEIAGTLEFLEVTEIKERRRLIEKQQDTITDDQKILRLLQNEQQRFLQTLILSRGLSLSDDFNVDSDSGVILRTAIEAQHDASGNGSESPDVTDVPEAAQEELAIVAEG